MEELPQNIQDILLYGSGKDELDFKYLGERGGMQTRKHAFEGIAHNFGTRYRETDSVAVREELAKYLNSKSCPECEGTRLRIEARHVKVGDKSIYEISRMPLKLALPFFEALHLVGSKQAIAEKS